MKLKIFKINIHTFNQITNNLLQSQQQLGQS